MIPWHDTDFYTGPGRVGATLSAVTVALVGIAGLPALVLIALARARDAVLHAREAVASEAGADTRVLRPGKTVLRGQVVGDLDAPPVVRIQIHQSGHEYTVKGRQRHKWTEADRTVDALPFTLRLASGQTVRVEPGSDVFLVDHLYVVETPHATTRTRVARLQAGEQVYVEGTLVAPARGGAYRSAETDFTLRPAAGQRMLISVEPLERRHQKRARAHGAWALGMFAALVVVHVGFFGSFWQGAIRGSVEAAVVSELRTWNTTGKHGNIPHYGVVAATGNTGEPARVEEVSRQAYVEAKAARDRGDEVRFPFVVLSDSDTRWVGIRPTLYAASLFVGWMTLVILVVGYVLGIRHLRPWYERDKVVDDGDGPLGAEDSLV